MFVLKDKTTGKFCTFTFAQLLDAINAEYGETADYSENDTLKEIVVAIGDSSKYTFDF